MSLLKILIKRCLMKNLMLTFNNLGKLYLVEWWPINREVHLDMVILCIKPKKKHRNAFNHPTEQCSRTDKFKLIFSYQEVKEVEWEAC